jgi:hypothetical protein
VKRASWRGHRKHRRDYTRSLKAKSSLAVNYFALRGHETDGFYDNKSKMTTAPRGLTHDGRHLLQRAQNILKIKNLD